MQCLRQTNCFRGIKDMFGKYFFTDIKERKTILENSKEILRYLSVELGERTLREYDSLQSARAYILDVFSSLGFTPEEQTYTVQGKAVSNIIVEKPGFDESAGTLVVAGHYDTVENTPGADDNATAIAAVLELARIVSKYQFRRTIRFIAVTLEEPPFFGSEEMGSMVYAKACRERGDTIDLAIVFDMLGFACKKCEQNFPTSEMRKKYPPYGDYLAVVSYPSLVNYVHLWKKIYNSHAKHHIYELVGPASIPGIELSDHSSFKKQGYPALLLTDTAFYRNQNYHMPGDTYETINFNFLAENICNIFVTLRELANRKDLFEGE